MSLFPCPVAKAGLRSTAARNDRDEEPALQMASAQSGTVRGRLGKKQPYRPRSRGLAAATGSDPVGRLMSRQHVADASDLAICTAAHGESLERKGWPGAIPQQVLQTLKIARHVAVDERDPNTGVD